MPNKQLALWVDKVFNKNEIFNPLSPLNVDDRLSSVRLLRERLAAAGWDCHTADFYLQKSLRPDAALFFDIPPRTLPSLAGGWGKTVRKLAVLFECDVIKPQNWDKVRHAEFDAVFTWSDQLVDGKKYFKLNFPQKFPAAAEFFPEKKNKFCALVAGNKKSSHPSELYSERLKTIRWFEVNHPAELDLYGTGWDKHLFTGSLPVRLLNRLPLVARLAAEKYPSYRGTVGLKKEMLKQYKFSICYENAKDIPGYITEKIFDSLFAGCVPVYWGAPDIAKHVPEDCFIDRRAFKTHEDLYDFMKGMTDTKYRDRLSSISGYLSGCSHYQFSDMCFAETILNVLVGG